MHKLKDLIRASVLPDGVRIIGCSDYRGSGSTVPSLHDFSHNNGLWGGGVGLNGGCPSSMALVRHVSTT